MKEKIRKLVNNTYIVHAIFILSMTQSFGLLKLLWLGGFIKDGSFSEFLTIVGSMAVSLVAILSLICLSMETDGDKKMSYKQHLIQFFMYLTATLIMVYMLHIISGGNPDKTLASITNNTSNIYDIIFNKTLYLIDMILILAIYASRKLYKIWNFLLKVLVFKTLFVIGIYFAFLSYINVYNAGINKNPSAFVPTTFYCENTYVETHNIFFIKNLDCPFKDSKEPMKELAKSGSGWAYMTTMGQKMDMREKAAIVVMYYEANKKFEETTWIERNLPTVYSTSMLATGKGYYQRNKDAELMVAKLILSGQETAAIEKAKELLAENKARKENKSQYTFLYYLVNPDKK